MHLRTFLYLILFVIHFSVLANSQKIIVGGDFDYPPYSYIDIKGNSVGHDIDVMNELSEIIGFDVSYKLNHWDTTLNALKRGEVDVVACIVYSEERDKIFDFTIPLHTEYYAIFSRKKILIKDVSDLQGKVPIVLEGDIANDKFLKPLGLFNGYLKVKSLPEAIMWLEHGKGDYVIAPYPLGMEIVKQDKCKNVEVKGPAVLPSVYCLAVKEGNTQLLAQLNNGIEELRNRGKLKTIHKRWIKYQRAEDRYRNFFKYSVWILVSICLLFFLWWFSLKKQLAKQEYKIRDVEGVYENVFNSMMDVLIIISPDRKIVDANPTALKAFNTNYNDFIGVDCKDILEEKSYLIFEQLRKETAKGKIFTKDALEISSNNITRFVNVKGSLLKYKGEEHHMAIIRDVTEETISKHKIQKAILDSESASRTKSAFLSTISHEIRTPLNAIIGFSRLLSNTELSIKQEDYNSKIGISGQLLLELITDVLDVTKIEAGKMDLESSSFRLGDLFKKIMDVQRLKAESKGLGFDLTISENVPETLIGDSLRLSQVILNLVSNAVKFTERGSVLVLVRKGSEFEKEGVVYERIWTTIKDTGIGVRKEKIDELFTPFTQSDSSNTRKFGGTGLGLSICKHLVELMGGELYVESVVGKGSMFSFFVALKKAKEEELVVIDARNEDKAIDYTILDGLRLLLVEDNPFNSQIYTEQLTSYLCDVKVAFNSEEGFEQLVDNEFDVILMDIELPEMDGFETTKKIKQYARWQDIPIIALSAYDSLEEKEKALKVGMVDYLSKPVQIQVLVATIVKHTRNVIIDNNPSFEMEFTGMKHFNGNERLFNRALARFASVYKDTPEDLRQLYQKEKYSEIKTIVHNLKSGAAMIGALDLDKQVKKIDEAMKLNVSLDKLELPKLITLLRQTIKELKNQIIE